MSAYEFGGQQALWDAQHAIRGVNGGDSGDRIIDTPNGSAVLFQRLLSGSTIAEVGSANGRDARYWAAQGHDVHCMDFSSVALDQLAAHAQRQGVEDRINPLHFDAASGELPDDVGLIDGFYARSALHVDDETLMAFLADVDTKLNPGGVVLIEGKGPDDPKIARSVKLGGGLAVDHAENGHLRRVWTHSSFNEICETFGWMALQQQQAGEQWGDTRGSFLRMVAVK